MAIARTRALASATLLSCRAPGWRIYSDFSPPQVFLQVNAFGHGGGPWQRSFPFTFRRIFAARQNPSKLAAKSSSFVCPKNPPERMARQLSMKRTNLRALPAGRGVDKLFRNQPVIACSATIARDPSRGQRCGSDQRGWQMGLARSQTPAGRLVVAQRHFSGCLAAWRRQ